MLKTAVITGASSGLGEAFCLTLLDNGWRVYGASRRSPAPILQQHTHFSWIRCDVTDLQQQQSLEQQIVEPTIDLLVNNAGIAFRNKTSEWQQQAYEKMFATNYIAPITLLNLFAPRLTNGMNIPIVSDSSHIGWPEFSLYGASKAALFNHMRSFAAERPDITTYLLHPDAVNTSMTDAVLEDAPREREHYMRCSQVANVLLQLAEGVLTLPSGASIFLHNNWEAEDMSLLMANTYCYNTDTQMLTPFRHAV